MRTLTGSEKGYTTAPLVQLVILTDHNNIRFHIVAGIIRHINGEWGQKHFAWTVVLLDMHVDLYIKFTENLLPLFDYGCE